MWDILNNAGRLYKAAILECTQNYNPHHIEKVLASIGGTVDSVVFSPHHIGAPCMRHRKYMVVTFTGGWQWKDESTRLCKSNFLKMFGAGINPSLTGSIYLDQTPKDHIREHIERMAKSSHMPIRDGNGKRWRMFDVMNRSDRAQVLRHKETLMERGFSEDADVFTTACQTVKRGTTSANVPALLQKSK
eukprot:8658586-Pyramimonas_sp.AAC.1